MKLQRWLEQFLGSSIVVPRRPGIWIVVVPKEGDGYMIREATSVKFEHEVVEAAGKVGEPVRYTPGRRTFSGELA